jgi:TonB family protein
MTIKSGLKLGMKLICAAVLFAFTGGAHAQSKAELEDRLHRAVITNSIDDAQVKPWHLKLSFQLFDDNGTPTEKGEIEEWWAAPDKRKTVYRSPSYTSTEIQTPDGLYLSAGMQSAPPWLRLIRDQAINPMPDEKDITDSSPELRHQDFGQVKMDCIMLAQPIKNLNDPPLGLFPTYCFDRDQDSLRISFGAGSQIITRNKVGIFQGRHVVVEQMIKVGPLPVISARMDTLVTASITEEEMTPPKEFNKVPSKAIQVASGVIAGLKISGQAPIYPENAKRNHISGKVVFRARIGTDGRLKSLRIVSATDGDLAVASMAAVRDWRYKPFILNGEPVEVDTQITTNFNFGPAF